MNKNPLLIKRKIAMGFPRRGFVDSLALAAAVNAVLESLSSTLPGVLEGLPAAAMPPIIKVEIQKVGDLMSKAASKLKGED